MNDSIIESGSPPPLPRHGELNSGNRENPFRMPWVPKSPAHTSQPDAQRRQRRRCMVPKEMTLFFLGGSKLLYQLAPTGYKNGTPPFLGGWYSPLF